MHTRTFATRVLVAFTTLLATLTITRAASADTIDLQWDPNPETQVIGYIVHVGTQPGSASQHIDLGPTTAWSYTSAVAGQQYCFTVSAYYVGPLEGPRSTEVCGVSNAPPVLNNPGNRISTMGQSTLLQLVGSDPTGDVLTYSATGLPPGLTVMASTGYISGTPTTAGIYTVTVRANDGVLTASQTFTWSIVTSDATVPAIAIATPTTATNYASAAATLTLGGTASDNVGVTQVSWISSRGGSGTAIGTTSWTAAGVPLQGGTNVLTVTARDAAGNTSTDTLTVALNVNTAPTLASVANQSSALGLATTLQLSASDANGDPLTYGATGLPSGLAVAATSGLISGTPTVAGTYAVTVLVSDGSLSVSRTFTWTIAPGDVTAPVVAIVSPTTAPTLNWSSWGFALGGTASDNVGVTRVTWSNSQGGSGTATGTTSWSTGQINLKLGVNVVTVTARDAAGNIRAAVLTVTYGSGDSTKPVVAIASPTAAATYSATSAALTLAGTASDKVGVTQVTWANSSGGRGVASGTSNWSAAVTLQAGVNVVTVTALDAAGNLATATLTVTYTVADTQAPAVVITAPTTAAAWTTGVATVVLGGTASDNVGVTQVSWVNNRGGTSIAAGTTSWSATVALQSGSNVIAVTARDAAGNTATKILTVTYNVADTTAPVVKITNPATATLRTTANKLVISGTASDAVGVTQVTWKNSLGWDGTATGTTGWTVSNVKLWTGVNIITITARDAAGNVGKTTVTVTKP